MDPGGDRGRHDLSDRPRGRISLPLTGATIVVAVTWLVAALFNLEHVGRGFDAIAQKASSDRIGRLGGSYYIAGVDHKGPLWTAAYRLADLVSPPWAYWFAIAAGIMAIAVVTGALAATIGRRVTGEWSLTTAVGVAVAAYLMFGPDEISRVLYSRNLTAALIALAFVLAARGSLAPGGLRAVVISGAAAGLAVQTNPTAALAAGVVGLVAVVISAHQPVDSGLIGPTTWYERLGWTAVAWGMPLVSMVLVAPAYYTVRGEFDEYRRYWWEYNQTYSEATGNSTWRILTNAVGDFGGYYGRHPLLTAVLLGFVLCVVVTWRSATFQARVLQVALIAWWLAEAVAVALAQRFFPHYLILTFVPTVAMAAVLAGRFAQSMPRRAWRRAPAVVIITVPLVLGGPGLASGLSAAGKFRGGDDHARRTAESQPPERRFERAIVDALASDDEYLLFWLRQPFPYDAFGRTSATRYLESRWLLGEVYGAKTRRRYVLPGSWDRWRRDVESTRPPIALVYNEVPVPRRSPMATLLSTTFSEVAKSLSARIYLRQDRLGGGGPLVCASVPVVNRPAQQRITIDLRSRRGPLGDGRIEFKNVRVLSQVAGQDADQPWKKPTEIGNNDHPPAQARLRLDVHERSALLWAGQRIIAAVPITGAVAVKVTTPDAATELAVSCP